MLLLMHLTWTVIFGYFEPCPLRMHISFYISMVFLIARLYIIPKRAADGSDLREKCKHLIYRYVWSLSILLQLDFGAGIIIMAVKRKAPKLEWLASLTAPMTKTFNDYIVEKFVIKYASDDNLVHARLPMKQPTPLLCALEELKTFFCGTP